MDTVWEPKLQFQKHYMVIEDSRQQAEYSLCSSTSNNEVFFKAVQGENESSRA
jgi:hypothetical protein